MKTLHVISPLPAGGAETVVLNLTTGLQAAGHPAVIAAIIGESDSDHPFVAAARLRGIEVAEIREGHRRYDRQTAAIGRAAAAHGVGVIHTHAPLADVMGHWAARRTGLPSVSTLHGFTVPGRRTMLYDIAVRWAHRHADAIVAVSTPIVSRLEQRGVRRDHIRLIPNAWHPGASPLDAAAARRELGVDPGIPHVGWVGRCAFEKGADVLIDAITALRHPSICFSIIGDGKLRPEIEARARAAGVMNQIRWHGTIPSAERILRAFDMLVLSSRSEGTPMVLLETMAANVPIVTTSVGGIPEMLSSGEALLVPPECPDLLAAAIRNSLDKPDAAAERAAKARARIDSDYSASSWIERHIALYSELMRAR
jgi:glycosyltransferase involved in cell wall biosynthesis